jgi:hypothetical protein
MNELESRVREALRADTSPVDADELASSVHRSATRRRAARTAVGASVASVLLVAGSVALQHRDDDHVPPQPLHSSGPTCADHCRTAPTGQVVDVSAAGPHVFELSVHDGCAHCSTVRERTTSGAWERIGVLHGGSRDDGPVYRLLMSANGRDGWAWQSQLWSTHDGGHTWVRSTTGPGRPTYHGRQVAFGTTTAWSVWTAPSGRQELWRTPIDRDAWERVPTSASGDLVGVLSSGEVVLHETGEGASGSVLVLGDSGTPSAYPQPFTSDSVFVLGGNTVYAPHGDHVSQLILGPGGTPTWQPVPRLPRGAGQLVPLDAEHLLFHAKSGWFVEAPGGTERTDLPAGAGIYGGSTDSGGTAWLHTYGGRVYSSTDAVHWSDAS